VRHAKHVADVAREGYAISGGVLLQETAAVDDPEPAAGSSKQNHFDQSVKCLRNSLGVEHSSS
jgi:hypothetical protein